MGLRTAIQQYLTKGALPDPSVPSMRGLDRSLVSPQEDVVADFRDIARYRYLSQYAKDMALDLALFNAKNMATTPLRLYTTTPRVVKGFPTRKVDRFQRPHLFDRRAVGAKAVQRADTAADVYEVTDHPILDLLTRPDPSTTAMAWNVLRFVNKQLFGDALLLIIAGSQRPIAGLPQLQPQWSDVQPDKTDRISGWYYGRDPQAREQYERDQVLQMKWADNPHDVYRGLGWLELATRELEIEDQALAAELTRWRNGGYPEGVLAFKNVKNSKQLDQAVDEFHKQLRRSRRKGGVIATSESAYTPLSVAQEMNYIPGLELIERRLLNRAGIPTTMYFMNDANLAGALKAESSYATNTLQPALIIDGEQWTELLIPRWGGDTAVLWFCYDAVGQENEEAILAKVQGSVPIGVATPNEGRALLGLPLSEDPYADKLLVGGIPLETLAKQAEAAAVAPVQSFGFAAFAPDFEGDPNSMALSLTAASPESTETKADTAPDSERASTSQQGGARAQATLAGLTAQGLLKGAWCDSDPYHADHACGHVHTKDAAEEVPAELLADFRNTMDGYFSQASEAAGVAASSGEAVSLSSLDASLKENLEPTMAEVMRLGSLDAMERIGQRDADLFELSPDAALEAVRAHASLVTEEIRGTTEDGIRRVIETALEEGLSSSETAQLVSAAVTDASPARAEAIARTETANAYGAGHQAAWTEAGVAGKRWLLAPDACSLCRALVKAQGPQKGLESKTIPMDKAFWPAGKMIVGDDGRKFTPRVAVMYPPLHPNDRCDFIPELGGNG